MKRKIFLFVFVVMTSFMFSSCLSIVRGIAYGYATRHPGSDAPVSTEPARPEPTTNPGSSTDSGTTTKPSTETTTPAKPADTKPTTTKPSTPAKPADTKPAPTKPSTPAKPADTKPTTTKPETTPAKPTDTKPTPTKPETTPAKPADTDSSATTVVMEAWSTEYHFIFYKNGTVSIMDFSDKELSRPKYTSSSNVITINGEKYMFEDQSDNFESVPYKVGTLVKVESDKPDTTSKQNNGNNSGNKNNNRDNNNSNRNNDRNPNDRNSGKNKN